MLRRPPHARPPARDLPKARRRAGRRTPQVHHRIAPPWAPLARALIELARRQRAAPRRRRHATQHQIARRQRIGLAERSERNVLRGPRTDPGERCHRSGELLGGGAEVDAALEPGAGERDRKSTRLNSSHVSISYAVFCLKKKKMHLKYLM